MGIKSIGAFAVGALGVGLVAYTVHYVAKEYDSMVDNYNDLVDKYNKNIDFINSCDFYEVKKDAPKEVQDAIKNNKFTEVKETKDDNGVVYRETFDPKSGFSVHEVSPDSCHVPHNNQNEVSSGDFKIV